MNRFLTNCVTCQSTTSRKYAQVHNGQCKRCAEPQAALNVDGRNARIIDAGYEAYAREEGHYDQGDY